jgi:hypothetical protein
MINKLYSDNSWLVDRLAEFSKEIDQLRSEKTSDHSLYREMQKMLDEVNNFQVADQYQKALS